MTSSDTRRFHLGDILSITTGGVLVSPRHVDDRMSFAASTGQGGTWESRTEVLWSNRPLGTVPTLFDQRS